MIISRTPYRISFFGGGTDYPEWYREHGGKVLATTIDKYCYLSCRYFPPFFDHKYRIVWSQVENRKQRGEIEHPVVREALKFLGIDRGIEIHHVGDLPARSGMGSSSAFTVGILHALHALQGRMVGKRRLMQEGIHVEQKILKEVVGSQDQVSAAMGGFNLISFEKNEEISVHPVLLPRARLEELEGSLMLFYTGILRTASTVATAYVTDLDAKKRQLRILKDLVDESMEILTSHRSLQEFGTLLDESWRIKKSLGGGISNPEVDGLYAKAKQAGAVGGKLTGAGGGGFLLFFVPPEKQAMVKEALKDLVHVPFKFESSGTQIIFHESEEDYAEVERLIESQGIRDYRELADLELLPFSPLDTNEEFHREPISSESNPETQEVP